MESVEDIKNLEHLELGRMTNYLDLVLQAKLDIDRSFKLYYESDYDLSAFSAQQGLEKYFKAYLMKEQIFPTAKDLGHLGLDVMLKKIVQDFTQMKTMVEKYQLVIELIDIMIEIFTAAIKQFEKLRKSPYYQMIFWKASLKIQLNEKESKDIQNFLLELEKGIQKGKIAKDEFLIKASQMIVNNPIKFSPQDEVEIGDLVGKIWGMKKHNEDISLLYKKILEITKPYYIKNGLCTEEDYEFFSKFQKFIQIFFSNMFVQTIFAFSHEQISRYPITIDGQSSAELYKQQKTELLTFLEKLKLACLKCDSLINTC